MQIAPIVDNVRTLLRQSLPRTIKLASDCTGVSRPILADTTQIKQLLLNLGLNARDAMPHGGSLKIRATDINMPDMNGPELVAAVRKRRPSQRILAMSGMLNSKPQQALQALQPPAEFLAKPISSESLLTALRRTLTRRSRVSPSA